MKRFFIIGLLSFFVGLCIYAPAQLMGLILYKLSNEKVGFANPVGSFWHGNAHVLLNVAQQTSTVELGIISWDTNALQLLAGKFAVKLSWNQGTPFWVTLDTSRLHIEHAVFSLPANIISTLFPTFRTAQLGGQFEVRCDNVSFTQQEIFGHSSIDWKQASSPLSSLNPLGNYRTELEGKGTGVAIQLRTLSTGPLILQGIGSWDATKGLHFEGTAEAVAASKFSLQELLRVIGNETTVDSGKYQLRF